MIFLQIVIVTSLSINSFNVLLDFSKEEIHNEDQEEELGKEYHVAITV